MRASVRAAPLVGLNSQAGLLQIANGPDDVHNMVIRRV